MKYRATKSKKQNAITEFNVPLELMDFKEVLEHCRRIARIPKNQLARMVGCPYSNFKRICNPDENYYPNVLTALSIDEIFLEHLGFAPLTEWMARQLGYTLVPLEEHPLVPETTPEQDTCSTMSAAGRLVEKASQALEDGVIEPEEAQELLTTIEALEQKIAVLKCKLKKVKEGSHAKDKDD